MNQYYNIKTYKQYDRDVKLAVLVKARKGNLHSHTNYNYSLLKTNSAPCRDRHEDYGRDY